MASSVLADRLPAMWFNATLATEVSRTSINVASITAKAMNQGLTAGFSPSNDVCAMDPAAMFRRRRLIRDRDIQRLRLAPQSLAQDEEQADQQHHQSDPDGNRRILRA